MTAGGNDISAASDRNTTSPGLIVKNDPALTPGENNISTGSTEGKQGSAGSADGEKVPTGSVSRHNICNSSVGNIGVSAGHNVGNEACTAPADDTEESTGSDDAKKVEGQRKTRKVKQKQAVLGR